jgi:hypothetical protein
MQLKYIQTREKVQIVKLEKREKCLVVFVILDSFRGGLGLERSFPHAKHYQNMRENKSMLRRLHSFRVYKFVPFYLW